MLFGRRDAANIGERLRLWLWPRVSWGRSTRYWLKRLLRLSATPHAIALGAAIGVFVSFTPFLGLQFALIFAAALLLRANPAAGAISSFVANPLTFPLIWFATFQLGHLLLYGRAASLPPMLADDLLSKPFSQLGPVLLPMAVGAVPFGLGAACIAYAALYKMVESYQCRRRRRLARHRPMPLAAAGLRAATGSPDHARPPAPGR